MKKNFKFSVFLLLTVFLIDTVRITAQTVDYKSLSKKASKLASDYPGLCTIKSLARTAGGREILVLTIGTGNSDSKPGIAVAGGIDGAYPFTRDIALGFAENLLRESATPAVKSLLEKTTFYVFPDVSPDASAQYFAPLKYERHVNERSTDDDRDFLTGEDPFEDLNGDGLITLIRVTDPSGTYIEGDEDSRVMVQADLSKGQKGMFLIYSEGTDNDKDGLFNEDGPGGVDFNKNFTYNYEEYSTNAGLHAVSEPESKAVADFLYDHFNIYTVICFGPQDNLGQETSRGMERTTQGTQQNAGGQQSQQGMQNIRMTGDRRLTSVMRTDETIIRLVANKYREITGLKGAPPVKTSPGNFADWAYYHYGRYSFSTPGWWFPAEKGKNIEASFLKYTEENKTGDVFVPWTEVKHPDFPGKKVEAGGIKPFAMNIPPAGIAEDMIVKNYRFVLAVAEMHPELEFTDVKVENPGSDIYRISLKVHNKGLFATCAEAGNSNMWTRLMRISLELSKGQSVISGQKVQRMQRIEGGKSAEYNWLVSGKGKVSVNAGAVNTGIIGTTLELK